MHGVLSFWPELRHHLGQGRDGITTQPWPRRSALCQRSAGGGGEGGAVSVCPGPTMGSAPHKELWGSALLCEALSWGCSAELSGCSRGHGVKPGGALLPFSAVVRGPIPSPAASVLGLECVLPFLYPQPSHPACGRAAFPPSAHPLLGRRGCEQSRGTKDTHPSVGVCRGAVPSAALTAPMRCRRRLLPPLLCPRGDPWHSFGPQ